MSQGGQELLSLDNNESYKSSRPGPEMAIVPGLLFLECRLFPGLLAFDYLERDQEAANY